MNSRVLSVIAILTTTIFVVYGFIPHTTTYEEGEGDIQRGEYLSTIIGCDHCHSPKQMTPQGPVPIKEKWMSGFPQAKVLPEIDKTALGPGKWELHVGDLTAFVGPWGVSFGANITPHETGIGNWTFDHFKKAMTKGKYKGLENSRPMLPPMPWPSYANMTDRDLRDIFVYLQSLTPVKNKVPAFIPMDKI